MLDNTTESTTSLNDKSTSNCTICLNTFLSKSYLLPCYHSYCFLCIRKWFQIQIKSASPSCPLCKSIPSEIVYYFNLSTKTLKKCDMDQLLKVQPMLDIPLRSYLHYFNRLDVKQWLDRSSIYEFLWVPVLPDSVLTKLEIWLPQFNPNTGKDEFLEFIECIPNINKLILSVKTSMLKEWIIRELSALFHLLQTDIHLIEIDNNQPQLDIIVEESIMSVIFGNFDYLKLVNNLEYWIQQYTIRFIWEMVCFILSGLDISNYDRLINYIQCD